MAVVLSQLLSCAGGRREYKTSTGRQRCDVLIKLLAESRSLFSHLSQRDPVLTCSVKGHNSMWPTCFGACSLSSVEENIFLLTAEVVPKDHLSTVFFSFFLNNAAFKSFKLLTNREIPRLHLFYLDQSCALPEQDLFSGVKCMQSCEYLH